MQQTTAIHWKSESKYVDIDTGEEITKHNAATNYIKIKLSKHVQINEIKTKGTIYYIHECRKQPQGKLFTDGA